MKGPKIIGIIFLVIIMAVIVFVNGYVYASYSYDTAPSRSSTVILSKITKRIYVFESHSCSTIDCKGSNDNYSKKLTNDEYKQALEVVNKYKGDDRYLCLYLSLIAEGKSIDSDKDKYDYDYEDYSENDSSVELNEEESDLQENEEEK